MPEQMNVSPIETTLSLMKLNRDIRNAAKSISDNEAKYLIKLYYQIQTMREAAFSQSRTLKSDVNLSTKEKKDVEPHECIDFMANQFLILEKEIADILKIYSKNNEVCKWMTSITGIGPIISCGFFAMIDIERCETAGSIWRYAGLDPTMEWKKGELRPWNAKLKTLCWKLGDSFVKVHNRESDVYGHIYKMRKEFELEKNERGEYAEEAKRILQKKKFTNKEVIAIYESGKLPLGHIENRARRYAVKIFLSHLFTVWYIMHHHKEPPRPYALAILGHAHEIEIPNFDKSLYLK